MQLAVDPVILIDDSYLLINFCNKEGSTWKHVNSIKGLRLFVNQTMCLDKYHADGAPMMLVIGENTEVM